MKSISKLLFISLMGNSSFSDPHLHKIILGNIYIYIYIYIQNKAINWPIKAINNRSKMKKSWHLEFWASKIMKSGFLLSQNEAEKSIEILKALSKYVFPIKLPNKCQQTAIIISVTFPAELIVQSPKNWILHFYLKIF